MQQTINNRFPDKIWCSAVFHEMPLDPTLMEYDNTTVIRILLLKEVKDHKDNKTWRCHKVHHVKNEGKNYTVKDDESVHQRKQLDIGCTTIPRTI